MNLANKAFFSYSIRDAEKACTFYKDVLGIHAKVISMCEDFKGVELTFADDMKVMLYEKKDHVPATFTVLNFEVNNIDQTVDELTEKGIRFESYESTDEKGISRDEGPQIAWFKDPDGNFLSVLQEERLLKYEGEYQGDAPQSPS